MHPILADIQGDWLTAAGVLLGGICTTLLALGAVIPAWRGNRLLTFALAAPAFLLGVVATIWLGRGDETMGRTDGLERTGSDVVVLWILLAGAPLITSLLVVSILYLRRRHS